MTDLRLLCMMVRVLLVLCGVALPFAARPVAAEPDIRRVPYAQVQLDLDAVITFETLPRRAEPGINLNAPMREGRAWFGEHLRGQTVAPSDTSHDRLATGPALPLTVTPGLPGANLSVAYHRGFGSNALFPVGPVGFPARSARGEGAVAILFDQDQRAIGLRIHSDYAAPLGQARPQGSVTLSFYTRQGQLIARHVETLKRAINDLGFERSSDLPDIAALTVTNDDPGGIALDDILYQTAPAAF